MRRSLVRAKAITSATCLIPPLAQMVADYDDITDLEKLVLALDDGDIVSPLMVITKSDRGGYRFIDHQRQLDWPADLVALLTRTAKHPAALISIAIRRRIAEI